MTTPGSRFAVELAGVEKSYGDVTALHDVTFSIARGEVHGLLGPNGAGKSTLLRLLFGLVRPDHGTLTALGSPVAASGQAGVAGFVDAPTFYPYFTARKNLEFLSDLDGGVPRTRIVEVLDIVGLGERQRQKVGTFSTGMRQRLGIAAALLRDPQLLILDEPTSGIDPSGLVEVHELITRLAAAGTTVLLSSHDMGEVERLCSSVTILRRGSLVYSSSIERLRDEAPAPSYALHTADDAVALSLAEVMPGIAAERVADGLILRAESHDLDGFVLALAGRGVAVRALTRRDTALEALFLRLTDETGAAAPERAAVEPPADLPEELCADEATPARLGSAA